MNHFMKPTLATVLGLVLTSFTGMAQAQSNHSTIKVNVPFDFKIGDKTVPAGEYSLVEPLQHFLELRDARGRFVACSFTQGVESQSVSTDAHLSFYVSGEQHILAEVWREGNQSGEQLYRSKAREGALANLHVPAHGSAGGRP